MKASALLALLMLWGCASDGPGAKDRADIEYRRADSRIQATEEFERRKETCAQAGGVLQVQRMSASRQPPRIREMRAATCSLAATAAGAY
jgi:hypothetical protein